MSEQLTPKHLPYTADELVDSGWVGRVRAAIMANGNDVCIGGEKEILANTKDNRAGWQPIMLPNGGTRLVDFGQCMVVIDMLKGKTPIPEPKPQA